MPVGQAVTAAMFRIVAIVVSLPSFSLPLLSACYSHLPVISTFKPNTLKRFNPMVRSPLQSSLLPLVPVEVSEVPIDLMPRSKRL